MKKWHTVALALGPILLLFLFKDMSLDVTMFSSNNKYIESAAEFAAAEDFSYALTFSLSFDNHEDVYRVIDHAQLNQYPMAIEYHRTEVRLESELGSQPYQLQYYEASDKDDGIVMWMEDSDPSAWVLMERRPFYNPYLPGARRVQAIVGQFDFDVEAYDKDDTFIVFRIIEDLETAEDYIDASLENYGLDDETLSNVYAESYYIDVAFDRKSGEIAGINIMHSSVGKAIGCYNGFFENERRNSKSRRYDWVLKDVDYQINTISYEVPRLVIPEYITMNEYIESMRAQ